ncbi:MAG: hypothetical protein CMO80_15750 [Verrucomicrobiales bacterium]|nr:hypothetical protein [Verrucomicrobiales bacterium]|tara:strand:- start:4721 stop:5197 length:477 start_codon:yes stop_codon:yes gene_type:complete
MSEFEEYEYISPADKPALMAVSSMETLANVQTICLELGYKVHVASNHKDWFKRFNAINYELVIVEELFAVAAIESNAVLCSIQVMPMNKRRHCVFVLVGDNYPTMNPLVAWQNSVHAVVARNDLSSLGQIVSKTVNENDAFLKTCRDVQDEIARGQLR